MEPESNTGLAIFIALLIFIAGIGGAFYYFFYREGKNPFEKSTLVRKSASNQEGSGGGQRVFGDINDNGSFDNSDVQMVRDNIGCSIDENCWDDVIGKTLSGDNPIYTSDLDLDESKKIDEADAQIIIDKLGK
jgi:flagellin-like hook-associated protein FlgL